MKLSSSSMIKIGDGEYARGKRVQVTNDNQYDAIPTVLEGLEFLSKIQQPGDELTLECESVQTKSGQATSCQVSLTKDRSRNISFWESFSSMRTWNLTWDRHICISKILNWLASPISRIVFAPDFFAFRMQNKRKVLRPSFLQESPGINSVYTVDWDLGDWW